jgi:hypothetical protein
MLAVCALCGTTGPEVVGDRVQPVLAQVDDVEVVSAELPQVLLHLAAQLFGQIVATLAVWPLPFDRQAA